MRTCARRGNERARRATRRIGRNHAGKPVPEWRRYDASGTPGHIDEEFYALDASHSGVKRYLRHVFATLRSWGATFFKTDFLNWGLKDAAKVRRHNPDETSVQSFRRVMRAIRESIGEDAYRLGCIAPYGPMLGFADGIRVANDTNHSASDGGTGNMLVQTYHEQYFNNVWWQSDPDVLFLRYYHIEMTPAYLEALAWWHGILGGSVNTSDMPHRLPPDRLKLLRFLQPGDRPRSARVPLLEKTRKLRKCTSHALQIMWKSL